MASGPNQLSDSNPDGTTIGQATTDKVSFHNATPIAQRASAAMVTLALTTATAGGTAFLSATGFTAMLAQLEEIRATLVAYGLHSGAA